MAQLQRQFFCKPNVVFTNKLNANDTDWFEIKFETVKLKKGTGDDLPTKGEIECTITQIESSAPKAIEKFIGGCRQKGNKVIITCREQLSNIPGFKLLLTLHKKNPDKDRLVMRTANGLKDLFKRISNGDDSNNGSPGDPDAEGFNRGGSNLPTVTVTNGTDTTLLTGTLQPGSVIINVTAPSTTTYYDFNNQLFDIADESVSVGDVIYDNGANKWRIQFNVNTTCTIDAIKLT